MKLPVPSVSLLDEWNVAPAIDFNKDETNTFKYDSAWAVGPSFIAPAPDKIAFILSQSKPIYHRPSTSKQRNFHFRFDRKQRQLHYFASDIYLAHLPGEFSLWEKLSVCPLFRKLELENTDNPVPRESGEWVPCDPPSSLDFLYYRQWNICQYYLDSDASSNAIDARTLLSVPLSLTLILTSFTIQIRGLDSYEVGCNYYWKVTMRKVGRKEVRTAALSTMEELQGLENVGDRSWPHF